MVISALFGHGVALAQSLPALDSFSCRVFCCRRHMDVGDHGLYEKQAVHKIPTWVLAGLFFSGTGMLGLV